MTRGARLICGAQGASSGAVRLMFGISSRTRVAELFCTRWRWARLGAVYGAISSTHNGGKRDFGRLDLERTATTSRSTRKQRTSDGVLGGMTEAR